MKFCVLNLSGNVGKSTLAVHLLAAFRPGAKFFSVETFNSTNAHGADNIEVQEWDASQFKEISRELMNNDEVILDVGASNAAAFMAQMKRFKSSVGEFDLILVPTVPDGKQQEDTISTIEWRETRSEAKKAGNIDAVEAAIEAQINGDLAATAQDNLAQVNGLLFGKGKRA